MRAGASTLPDFANPPVIEVLLGVQFDRLVGLRTPHLGLLWKQFESRFPRFEEYPPLDPMAEVFGVRSLHKIEVRLQLLDGVLVPRLWLLNEAGTEVIQVQQDRFIHNWRKVTGVEPYPRYEHIKEVFLRELGEFQAFLEREQLGQLVPDLCEVTYINHIVVGDGVANHGQLGAVVNVWASDRQGEFLPEAEQVGFVARYVIPGSGSSPMGRLYIEVQPGYRTEDNHPILIMTLTARGRPDGQGLGGIVGLLDMGREWIVRSFATITSASMHTRWERRDGQ